jgi:nucleoside-diphosphate-sugar epimerase
MKAAVTGAGGFVGGAIARALHRRGEDVRSYSRGEYPRLAALGIEHRRGDICDPDRLAEALAGVDVVFHAAARVAAAGAYAEFYATNVSGTRHVVEVCRRAGVRALVHTSTPSVVFGPTDLEGVDESIPYATHFDAAYGRTKAEAERIVRAADGPTLRTVSLRPHLVWGPGDTSLFPRLIERARAGAVRRIAGPPKKTDITYVDDAVQAHLAAADRLLGGGADADRIGGRAYFLSSGEPVEVWTFVDRLLAVAGLPPARGRLHPRVAMTAAFVSERAHALLRRKGEPRLSPWIVRELTTSRWFDIGAARRDLGYDPKVGLEEGLSRLHAWWEDRAAREHG